MDLKQELMSERLALREEILSVGEILSEHRKKQEELSKLTEKYQSCEVMEEKAAIAVRVMDLRIAIDTSGVDKAELEARIDEAFGEYDRALMDALIASKPAPAPSAPVAPAAPPAAAAPPASNGIIRTVPLYTTSSRGFPPITNKCPLCDGYKRAEFDFCRNCYMDRNPAEFDTCVCGKSKHVRYEMCGTCFFEEQSADSRFS